MVEQSAHNRLVSGSNPEGPTNAKETATMQVLETGDIIIGGCESCPLAMQTGVRLICRHTWTDGESAHVSDVRGNFVLVGCPLLETTVQLRLKKRRQD